jgi:hypothetical protein
MLPGVTTQHLSRLCIQHWPPRGHRRIIGAPSPSLRPCGFTAGMAKIPATAWRLGRSLILSLSPGPVPGDGCVARVRGERVSSLESPHPLASCLVRSVRLYRLHKETADAWVSGSRLPDEVQYNRFFPFSFTVFKFCGPATVGLGAVGRRRAAACGAGQQPNTKPFRQVCTEVSSGLSPTTPFGCCYPDASAPP